MLKLRLAALFESIGTPVLVLSFFKKTLGYKVMLNVLVPLVGAMHAAFDRRLAKWTAPLGLLGCYGIALGSFNGSPHQMARSVQLLLIFFFLNFLLFNGSKKVFINAAKAISVLSLIWPFIEMMFGHNPIARKLLGVTLYRYGGIVGEPNFSAGIALGAICILGLSKKWWWSLPGLFSLFFYVSRSSVVGIALITLLVAAYFFSKKLSRVLGMMLIIGSIIYPFIVGHLDIFLKDEKQIDRINIMTSRRYELQSTYYKMAIENPLGVGYFENVKSLKEFDNPRTLAKYREPHHYFLHVLVDLGFPGLLLISGFFILFYSFSSRVMLLETLVWAGFFGSYNFFNGIHETMIYIFMAFILCSGSFSKDNFLKQFWYYLRPKS
jgi:hypothetical protein